MGNETDTETGTDTDTDTDVVVVGAGPAGLMLAGELRLGGARVVVLDALPAPTTESRASTLHARTMEQLDQRGLLDRLGAVPRRAAGHFGGIPLDLTGLDSRFAGQWTVPQQQVEALLGDWAGELGAELRRGSEMVGMTSTARAVTVRAVGPTGPVRLTARYVVGCDGCAGPVRRWAGIGLDGTPATRQLFRADVTGIEVRPRRFERLPGGLAIAGTLPSGAARIMLGEHGPPPAPRTAPATWAEVCAAWLRVTGEDLSAGTPLWVDAFDDAALLATAFRRGRVLLAGDAAHRQLPANGQSINLALQDAVNLGWKLAAQVTGRAAAGLLDSYETERRAVARRALRVVSAQSMLLLGGREVDPLRSVLTEVTELPAARLRLAGMISGLDVRYEPGRHPCVGARLPHLDLGDGVSTTSLLRTGRGLLLDFTGDPVREARLALVAGRRVDVVPAARSRIGPDTALVRPDGYVAWAGSRAEDPSPALRRWFGGARRPAAPAPPRPTPPSPPTPA